MGRAPFKVPDCVEDFRSIDPLEISRTRNACIPQLAAPGKYGVDAPGCFRINRARGADIVRIDRGMVFPG